MYAAGTNRRGGATTRVAGRSDSRRVVVIWSPRRYYGEYCQYEDTNFKKAAATHTAALRASLHVALVLLSSLVLSQTTR